MSTKSAESREGSPDVGPEKRASKKRKVLSCYACRNRKMKCDRIYPVCGRCQRTGRADQCTYDPRLLDDLTLNGDGHGEGGVAVFPPSENAVDGEPLSSNISTDSLTWRFRMQERRLEAMERRLERINNANNPSYETPPSHLESFDVREQEPVLKEDMVFRGKGFKTQFYGSTSVLSVLTQVYGSTNPCSSLG